MREGGGLTPERKQGKKNEEVSGDHTTTAPQNKKRREGSNGKTGCKGRIKTHYEETGKKRCTF